MRERPAFAGCPDLKSEQAASVRQQQSKPCRCTRPKRRRGRWRQLFAGTSRGIRTRIRQLWKSFHNWNTNPTHPPNRHRRHATKPPPTSAPMPALVSSVPKKPRRWRYFPSGDVSVPLIWSQCRRKVVGDAPEGGTFSFTFCGLGWARTQGRKLRWGYFWGYEEK